jgi:hypothetical protein
MSQLLRAWIDCNSPLLLVEKEVLHAWEGTDIPSDGRTVEARFRWNPDGPATDYDRACDVDDYLGLIDVGNGKGLVLGDEPLMTTWLPLEDSGLLVRWICADSEAELLEAAQNIPDDAYDDCGLSFIVKEPPLVLFAACESGEEPIYDRIEIKIPPGSYRISTKRHEADETTAVLCHRLEREKESQ